ncbi:unnamed protein product [Protopolystoma xenopodis]|uniref:Uncharacterized protein n=1 Tax=Protopolystoma xenopodis TaxID=117903 RepID=A0A448XIR6_9PLAT|nr:unnamed protein product [Protopolystoma xenopodis]
MLKGSYCCCRFCCFADVKTRHATGTMTTHGQVCLGSNCGPGSAGPSQVRPNRLGQRQTGSFERRSLQISQQTRGRSDANEAIGRSWHSPPIGRPACRQPPSPLRPDSGPTRSE